MVQAHIYFSGTVQGVGFRIATVTLAQEIVLTGWVKNLSDGRVEVIAEGPRQKIEELLSRLKEQFGSYIRDQQIEWSSYKGEFKKFSII